MKVLYIVRKNASDMTSVSSLGDVPRVMRGFLFAILFVGLIIPMLSNIAVSDSGPSKPVIHSFEAKPGIINPTENATLSWNVSDATNITINPGDFWLEVNKTEATGRSKLNGSMIVHPNNSTNYTLTAENANGNTTANTSLIIKGSYASSSEASNPVINYFSAYPSSIRAGEGSVLSWSVSNAASVTISGLGNVALKGSTAVMPKLTSRYVLIAENGFGRTVAELDIYVEKPKLMKPVINYFSAGPGTIQEGGSSALTWSVSGASNVVINNGVGPVRQEGRTLVRPYSTTYFTLAASNDAGSVSTAVQVAVVSKPKQPIINYFSADKSYLSIGDSTTLYWSVSGASGIEISGIGAVGPEGSLSVTPSSSRAYSLRACNGGVCASGRVFIEVNEVAIQPIEPMPKKRNPIRPSNPEILPIEEPEQISILPML